MKVSCLIGMLMARATLWEDEDVYVFHDSDGHDSEKDLKKKKIRFASKTFS